MVEKVTRTKNFANLDPSAYPELSISKIKKEKAWSQDDEYQISNIQLQFKNFKQESDDCFMDFEATGSCITVEGHPVFKLNESCEEVKRSFIKCGECNSEFESEHDLKVHQSIHKDEISCNVCNKKFQIVLYLKRHIRLHMKNNRCSICSKTFYDGKNLQKHMDDHTTVKNHACRVCNKAFATEASLKNHRRIHSESYHNQLSSHTCGICNKTFGTKFSIRKHMRRHMKNFSFECTHCGEVFGVQDDLKIHMSVHDKELVCNFCKKQFFSVRYLRLHVKIHMNTSEPYQCSLCDRTFKLPWGLSSHMSRHREKRHKCAVCSKMFFSKGALRIHLVVHTGDKPYCCSVCGKGFTQRHCVKKHMTLHTGKLPYVCEKCPESFDKKMQLEEHLQIHDGDQSSNNVITAEDVKVDIAETTIQNIDNPATYCSSEDSDLTTLKNSKSPSIRIKTEMAESQLS